jgi:exopolysaccharide biosynthesis protein
MKNLGLFFCLIFLSQSCFSMEVYPGVIYKNIIKKDPNLSIHIAHIDPSKVSLVLEAAHGKCNGTENVSDLAKENDAIIAINGGFFDFGQKNKLLDFLVKILDCFGINVSNTFPVFCLKIRNKWFSISNKNAGFIGWHEFDKRACLGTVQITWQLQINEYLYPIVGINKPYAQGPILYTPAYDVVSPAKNGVTEIVVEDGKIMEIINGDGETVIPANGFIYAIESQCLDKVDLSSFVIGESVSIIKTCNNEKYNWDEMDYLLGSTPLLVENGQITKTVLDSQSSFFTKRHPRTAIGILENGDWVMVVVDGRQSHSCGMTMLEIAQFMKELDSRDALNLDGGGSSVMVVKNEIVNSPSGREWGLFKGERPISNSIMVLKPD